jgi:trk system potassium uptake protein TrkA
LFVPKADDELIDGDQIYVCTHNQDLSRTLEIFGKKAKKQERVIIVGGGNVGLRVAQALENGQTRMRAKVIERNRACAENAADVLERTVVLHGDGLDMDLMEEANLQSTDALLAVTDDDKTNLLACARAKAAGCPMVVALINDPSLTTLKETLGIDVFINPRATTVSSILRHIRHGRVRSVYSVGDAEAEVIEAQVMSTSPIAGKRIRDIDFPAGTLIGSIKKGEDILRPSGNTKIEEGDLVVIFALSDVIPEVERLFQVNIDFF